jgi:hypothetical protein
MDHAVEMTKASHELGFNMHPLGHPFHVVRTWLRAERSAMLSTCSGPLLPSPGTPLSTPPGWPADALLLAVVEAAVRADFVHRAECVRMDVDFYESTALARWSEGETGPELLDLVVEPRIGVHCASDIERARALFDEVASGCLAAHALRIPLMLKPTVELWAPRPACAGGFLRND